MIEIKPDKPWPVSDGPQPGYERPPVHASAMCRGSGFVMGGYRDEFAHDTIRVMCSGCWRMVDAVPIDPEVRTDLRTDGEPVTVLRKRTVDHAFGSVCAMRWRRDAAAWMFRLAVFMVVGAAAWGMATVILGAHP